MKKMLLFLMCFGVLYLSTSSLQAQDAYDISEVTTNDAEGLAESLGLSCQLTGIVHGINMFTDGLQFTLIDATGGIAVFSPEVVDDYAVSEGDEVSVIGIIDQFNGLTELLPNSIEVLSNNNDLAVPTTVEVLDEATESELITLACVSLVDPNEWDAAGGGFNVNISDGINNYQMRIDADTDLFDAEAPTGTFNLTGLGGQFDPEAPYDEGYQIFPRYTTDIELVGGTADAGFTYTIDGTIVTFIADNPDLDSYDWDFGDGSAIGGLYLPSPTHPYEDNNFYTACLTVEASSVCGGVGEEVTHCETFLIGEIISDYPLYDIIEVTGIDADGVSEDLGLECELRGVVYGVDLALNNTRFTLIDPTDGIRVFANGFEVDYEVNEGDSIHVAGYIDQDDGVTQIVADSIVFINNGNDLKPVTTVATLDETTESDLVRMECMYLVDPDEWGGLDGGFNSFDVEITNGTDTVLLYIDNDVDIFGEPAPSGVFNVTGVGAQDDGDEPLFDNYQIVPRYMDDLETVSTINAAFGTSVSELTATFTAVNAADAQSVLWDFGDGTTSTELIVEHEFEAINDYTICLTVFDDNTCGGLEITNCQTMTIGTYIYEIGEIDGIDADGVVDSIDVYCELRGIVYGGDLSGGSVLFFMRDETGGILAYNADNLIDYDVMEGDSVHIVGTVDQFNGQLVFFIDSLSLIDGGHPIAEPMTVTELNEETESELVVLECVSLVDPDDWGGFQGFFIDVTDGTNTYTVEIDNSSEVLFMDAPTGIFNLVGMASQDDEAFPLFEDYIIIPYYETDIIPVSSAGTDFDLEEIDLTLNLEALEAADADAVLWDFGDGTTSTEIAPSHEYPEIGVYTICLTVYDTNDCGSLELTECTTLQVGNFIYDIGDITTVDDIGEPDSLDVNCEIRGIVHGVNLRPQGLQFTLIDATGGIQVYENNDDLGYTVQEGDSIHVVGEVDEFRGMTRFNAESIVYISSGNDLQIFTPVFGEIGEEHESELIMLTCMYLDDPNDWGGGGGGGGNNILVTDGTNEYTIRVDNDTNVFALPAPEGAFIVIGLGYQNDNNEPYDEGYSIMPRSTTDILPLILPSPSFNLTAAGATVTANYNTEGEVASYAWDFGDGTIITNEPNPTHTYADNGNYTITLTIITSLCAEERSASETYSVNVLGINDITDTKRLLLYPNPSSNWVNISTATSQVITNVQVQNVLGETVLNKRNTTPRQSLQINMEAFSTGVYFVSVQLQNGQEIVRKLVKE